MLRIISGERGGRIIKSVEGINTRPTTDRTKESLFNILHNILSGSTVLDLFAGSGNLGLEALSRGSDYAVFVERNRKAVSIINENIKDLGYVHKSNVIKEDAFKAVVKLSALNLVFDIIFLDPPYKEELEVPIITCICENNILSNNGIVVLEHLTSNQQPDNIGFLIRYDLRKYGNTSISFYRRDSKK